MDIANQNIINDAFEMLENELLKLLKIK